MAYRILPYRQGSRSARALAQGLNGRVLKLEGSRWRPRVGDVIINWGVVNYQPENFPRLQNTPVELLNPPPLVRNVSNKLNFFNMCRENGVDEYVPDFWTNMDEIGPDAFASGGVVCRTVLAGHSGEGIILANSRDELVPAPLYTKYIKKSEEYRIHLGLERDGGVRIISQQRKARNRDVPDEQINWQVRNHTNGFIFAREGFEVPPQVIQACKQVFLATGLDFGAVDVVYNARQERAYVLEINTAPGLEGSTVDDYVQFFTNEY